MNHIFLEAYPNHKLKQRPDKTRDAKSPRFCRKFSENKPIRHCSRIARVMGSNPTRVICLWYFFTGLGEYTVLTHIGVWVKTKSNNQSMLWWFYFLNLPDCGHLFPVMYIILISSWLLYKISPIAKYKT